VLVKQAILSEDFHYSMVGGLVEELRLLTSTNFIIFRVSSVSRNCNRFAHELVVVGRNCDERSETIINSLLEHIDVIVAEESSAHE